VGGDRIDYSGDIATSTTDITTFKLPRFEKMKMLLSRFREEIIQKYNLNALAVGGWVYIEIRKGMYGLRQAG
jgi:hypothetical protein